jgi:uncharacterized membrane protein YfcA
MAELAMSELFVVLGAALFGSIISGMIGMGGGILLLTVLFLCGLPPEIAIPVHAVVQVISNGSRLALFREHVRWRAWRVFALFALPCPIVGLVIANDLDPELTKVLIGVLVIFATWRPKGLSVDWKESRSFACVGVLAGTLGVVVGATGPLVAPFFLREGWRKEEVIATKAACQVFGHLQKIIAFGLIGFSFEDELVFIFPLAVAVVIGTWTGKQLLSRLSEHRFRLTYRVVLSGLAIRLMLTPLL